jgi:hypothetical protein
VFALGSRRGVWGATSYRGVNAQRRMVVLRPEPAMCLALMRVMGVASFEVAFSLFVAAPCAHLPPQAHPLSGVRTERGPVWADGVGRC